MNFYASVELDSRDPDFSWLKEDVLTPLQEWPAGAVPLVGEEFVFRGPRLIECVVISRAWQSSTLGLSCAIKVWTRKFYVEQVANGWEP